MAMVKSLILCISLLHLHIFSSRAAINLYVKKSEVQRVLGFDAELYFIRRGEENWNAIHHHFLLAETVDYITFSWNDEQPQNPGPVLYASLLHPSDDALIKSVTTNLKSKGNIPQSKEENFQLNATCYRRKTGSALIKLQINLTLVGVNDGNVQLDFTFQKLCKDDYGVNLMTTKSTEGILEDKRKWKEKTAGVVNKTSVFYIAVGVACSLLLVMVTAIAFLHVQSIPKQDEVKDGLVENEGSCANENTHLPKALQAVIAEKRQKELLHLLKDYIIRTNLLSLGNAVQEGSFGRANVGTVINAESGEEFKVLVKSVTDEASPEQVTLFIMESSMLKRTTHHNVLPLMHLCVEDKRLPLMIYPYLNRGNLKNYLRLTRTAEPLSKPLTTRDIVLMAIQIARGLLYLSRRRLIHKDVATRNCVVDEDLHVKVTDNALSRDFFPGDYHCLGDNENRPVRWMACECLESNTFLIASDVWSYGVLLWELSTLAQTPYANVDPFEMLTYLKSGLRLPQPANCPDDLFTVMACCWALSPEERPHFTQIIACLEAFINKLNAFI